MGPIMGGGLTRINVFNARATLQGQSNCWGVGAVSELVGMGDGLAALAAAEFDRVYIDNGAGYEKLRIGVNNRAYAGIGPEFGLAVRWMRETTQGNLFIDKSFLDGSAIAPFQLGSGNNFFEGNVINRATRNAWLATNGFTGVVDSGWVWVQGEGDAAATLAYYDAQLNTLVASMASSSPIWVPASAKKIITQVYSGANSFGAGTAAAKVKFVNEHPTARLVTYTNNFNGDNVHLNARGQVQLGYDAFAAIFNQRHVVA